MAFVFRLIGALLALLVAQSAHAVIPLTNHTEYTCDAEWQTTRSAACNAFRIEREALSTDGHYEIGGDNPNCSLDWYPTTGTPAIGHQFCVYQTREIGSCPTHSTEVGGSCTCNQGYTENSDSTSCLPLPPPTCTPPQILIDNVCQNPPPECLSPKVLIGGVCQDPPECAIPLGSISNGSTGQFTGTAYRGGMSCFQNCVSYPSFSGAGPDGTYFAHGPWTSTGVACSGTGAGSSPTGDPADPADPPADPDPPPVQPPPDSCKVGQCPGSINGTTVCVPCSNTTSNTANKTNSTNNTTNPDGTPGTPPSGGAPNGTTNNTTTNTTKCIGGKCTTTSTSTTKNPDGTTTTKTDKKEETQEDFCTKNPKSPMCVEGSFGGACNGGWTCTGDAVQCATAKAVNDQACSLKVDAANPVLAVGNAAMAGGNGDGHPRSSATDIDVGSLNQTNPWGSGCPADRTLTTFMGEPIVVPLSSACSSFQLMGNLLVGLAMLAGAFIVVGRT